MKNPTPVSNWNFIPDNFIPDRWFLNVDNPRWGDNAHASTSSGYKRPRLEYMGDREESPIPFIHVEEHSSVLDKSQALIPYDQEFAVKQILNSLHPGTFLNNVQQESPKLPQGLTLLIGDLRTLGLILVILR